jgi:hypothetical protein
MYELGKQFSNANVAYNQDCALTQYSRHVINLVGKVCLWGRNAAAVEPEL